MKSADATRILLTRKKTTNKLRKQCARARETVMRSATPIYKEVDTDEFGHEQTEYFSSKPLEVTPEQRLAAKLRWATLEQLQKWTRRNLVREAACFGVAERSTKDSKRKQKFELLAAHHLKIFTACQDEIRRRKEKVASRGN